MNIHNYIFQATVKAMQNLITKLSLEACEENLIYVFKYAVTQLRILGPTPHKIQILSITYDLFLGL